MVSATDLPVVIATAEDSVSAPAVSDWQDQQYREVVGHALGATGARIVALALLAQNRERSRLLVETSLLPGPLRAAIAAARRVVPDFDLSRLNVRARANPLLEGVYRTGQPVEGPLAQIAAGGLDSRLVALCGVATGITWSCVYPVRASNVVVGTLSFHLAAAPGDQQRRACESFARQMSLAVEHNRLLAAEQRRATQAERLAATLAAVGEAADLESALLALAHGALALLGGVQSSARIFGSDPNAASAAGGPAGPGGAHRVIVRADGRAHSYQVVKPPAPGGHAWQLQHGAPAILVEDLWELDPATYPHTRTVRQDGVRASVNVPIDAAGQSPAGSAGQSPAGSAGRRIGCLHVDHPEPGFFTHADLAIAQALAAQAGGVVERARLAQALRESREQYRAVAEQSADGIIVAIGDRIVFANAAAASINGLPDAAALVGTSVMQVLAPEDRELLRARALARQRGQDVPARYECRIRRADGELRTVEVAASRITFEGQAASLGLLRDVTERRRTEQRLAETNAQLERALADLAAAQQREIEQERLRALGQLTAGIAHDLNNALAPVLGFAELLLTVPTVVEDATQRQRYLDLIHTGAQDAASVVARLREFYRPGEGAEVFAAVDAAQVLDQVAALTRPKWKDQAQAAGRSIAVVGDLPPAPLPPLLGNAAALREALTNLIFNAVDAMPQGGTITLRAYTARAQAPLVAPLRPALPGPDPAGSAGPAGQQVEWVVLEVADTGLGMTEEVRRRCLEPFFSTKAARGTGLGLSMVYGTAQRHGGRLEIESAVGQGTVVRLFLPAHPSVAAAPVAPALAAGAGSPARQSLRVLVVDDEPAVRELTAAFLEQDGHQPVLATGGPEALQQLRAAPLDLVITDLSMPDLSGIELALAVKQLQPHLPVILFTGFGDLIAAAGEQPPGVDLLLHKPASLEGLRRALAHLVPPENP